MANFKQSYEQDYNKIIKNLMMKTVTSRYYKIPLFFQNPYNNFTYKIQKIQINLDDLRESHSTAVKSRSKYHCIIQILDYNLRNQAPGHKTAIKEKRKFYYKFNKLRENIRESKKRVDRIKYYMLQLYLALLL